MLDHALAEPMQRLRARRRPILRNGGADPPVGCGKLLSCFHAVETLDRPSLDRGGAARPHFADPGLAHGRQARGLRAGADLGEPFRNGSPRGSRQVGQVIAKIGEGLLHRLAIARDRHFARQISRLDPHQFGLVADRRLDQAQDGAPTLEQVVHRNGVGNVRRFDRLTAARHDVAQQARERARGDVR